MRLLSKNLFKLCTKYCRWHSFYMTSIKACFFYSPFCFIRFIHSQTFESLSFLYAFFWQPMKKSHSKGRMNSGEDRYVWVKKTDYAFLFHNMNSAQRIISCTNVSLTHSSCLLMACPTTWMFGFFFFDRLYIWDNNKLRIPVARRKKSRNINEKYQVIFIERVYGKLWSLPPANSVFYSGNPCECDFVYFDV